MDDNREIFSTLAAIPPFWVRLDGRAFHSLTAHLSLERPFDLRFSEAMAVTASALVGGSGLSPCFAYTFSDEISLYFTNLPFRGRVEKIDSVAASYAASALTLALGVTSPLAFDARVVFATPVSAREYLIGRQQEAWRNHINAYCQHALISEGLSSREAASRLKGLPGKDLHDLMHRRGVNLTETPAWHRRGLMARTADVTVSGYNPIKKEEVTTVRHRVIIDRDLPLFSSPEGEGFLSSVLGL